MFSVATARITPKLVEKFDSESLDSNFVLVEKECQVKFSKNNNCFSVTGEWSSIRDARLLLQELLSDDEHIQANVHSRLRKKAEQALKSQKRESIKGRLYKIPGNPRKGRYKECNSIIPEPRMFIQYHDTTFDRLEDLDLDTVLDDFERTNVDKKVTKEYLKKVLNKRKHGSIEEEISKTVNLPKSFDNSPVEANSQSDDSLATVRTPCNDNSVEHFNDSESVLAVKLATVYSNHDPVISNLSLNKVVDTDSYLFMNNENNLIVPRVPQTFLNESNLNLKQNSSEFTKQCCENSPESFLGDGSQDLGHNLIEKDCAKPSKPDVCKDSRITLSDSAQTSISAPNLTVNVNHQILASKESENIKENSSIDLHKPQPEDSEEFMLSVKNAVTDEPDAHKNRPAEKAGSGNGVSCPINVTAGTTNDTGSEAVDQLNSNLNTKKTNVGTTRKSTLRPKKLTRKPGKTSDRVDDSSNQVPKARTHRKRSAAVDKNVTEICDTNGDTAEVPQVSTKVRKQQTRSPRVTATAGTTETKVYKCTECDYIGFRKKRLTEHMGRMHGLLTEFCRGRAEKTSFECDMCDKTFVFGKDLSRHKRIVHHSIRFECSVCHKVYKSKYVYEKHKETHVEGYVQPMFKCDLCDREFTTKFSLTSHIKSTHLELKKTYSCPTCGKTFSQIRSYRQHANVHAGIRPYTCEICGKSFTYDKSLKEHRYMHDNERRFPCTVCDKSFRQKTCLLIHSKVHNESKNLICGYCGKAFVHKQSLIRHERTHTGDRPYQCGLCQKRYTDHAVIRKHLQLGHKLDKESWKQYVIQEDRGLAPHYIHGGPGYKPRLTSEQVIRQSNNTAGSVQSEVNDQTVKGNAALSSRKIVNTAAAVGLTTIDGKYTFVSQISSVKNQSSGLESEVKPVLPFIYTNIQLASDTGNMTNVAENQITPEVALNVNPQVAGALNQTASQLPTSSYLLYNIFPGYNAGLSNSEGPVYQTLNYLPMEDESFPNTYIKSPNKDVQPGTNVSKVTIPTSLASQSHEDMYSLTPVTQVVSMAMSMEDSTQTYLSNTSSTWTFPTYADMFYSSGVLNQYQQSNNQQQL